MKHTTPRLQTRGNNQDLGEIVNWGAVQIFKEGMKGLIQISVPLQKHTTYYNWSYPAKLMMVRQLRSHLSFLIPYTAAKIATKQQNQKEAHGNRAKKRIFEVDNSVFVCKFQAGNSLLPGVLVRERGPLSYTIQLENHHIHFHSETSQTKQTQKDTVSEDFDVPTMDSLVDTQETKSEVNAPPLPHRPSRTCCPPDHYQPDQY